ncbi:hypothetical protein IQ06DRAFT_31982 [Phaeosphaeriaceae sp. SRC1lsM3a]|nr:hypothetical protein IQ06DRAFT_31982 [Stagonospora sp. SRC1lsM3a]
MSTVCLTIHDLLRITYTYEAQAQEQEAQARKRSDSACSVSLLLCSLRWEHVANIVFQMPHICSYLSAPTSPSPDLATMETDFTNWSSRRAK